MTPAARWGVPESTISWFSQAWCRRVGIVALAIAGGMAVASAPLGVLHDSVVHAVRITGSKVPDTVTYSIAAWVCVAYWLIWFAALITAVYMAFLDFRFIRLRYALESKALFRQSLGDKLSERVMRKEPRR